MTFDTFNISQALKTQLKHLNHLQSTEIQKRAIPVILSGKDILAAAQTGTGKTAAFGLPILDKISKAKREHNRRVIQAIVLAPTRELAEQINQNLRDYGKNLDLTTLAIYGGVKIPPQILQLKRGVDILIATPGRLIDLYKQRVVDLTNCQYLVLDEADRMLDMGFIHDMRRILSYLPRKRQTMLFSATFSEEIRSLAKEFVYKAVEVSATPQNSTATLIKQSVYPVNQKQKAALLAKLIHQDKMQQVLVFTRTKHGANRLVGQLENEHIISAAIHGNKSQSARLKALSDFKEGKIRVLVATDIAARGLDIQQLPVVFNFELPQSPEDYVHRIGRTGRAGAAGRAISLVCFEEYGKLLAIEKLIKKVLPRKSIEGFEISTPLPISHLNRKKFVAPNNSRRNETDKKHKFKGKVKSKHKPKSKAKRAAS